MKEGLAAAALCGAIACGFHGYEPEHDQLTGTGPSEPNHGVLVKTDMPERVSEPQEWMGWVWIAAAGAGLIMSLALARKRLLERKSKDLTVEDKIEISGIRRFLRELDRTEDGKMDEKSEKREEEYRKKLSAMRKRLNDAKTVEECSKVREEFYELSTELEKKDKQLFKKLSTVNGYFFRYILDRIGIIDGTKKVLKLGKHWDEIEEEK